MPQYLSNWMDKIPAWAIFVPKAFLIVAIFVGILFLNRTLTRLLTTYLNKHPKLTTSHALLITVLSVIVWGIGILILLDSLGVTITPLLASLGVGSLAAGLALQDTLGNLFGGFYLMLDHPLSVGDPVRLDSGEEGVVERIAWRATHIRLAQDNILIIPNRSLVTSRFINHNMPGREMNLIVEFTASQTTDLERLEAEALKTAITIQKNLDGIRESAAPIFNYVGFVDLGIRCSLTLRVPSFAQTAGIRHALIKKLHANLKGAGITLPAIGPAARAVS